MCVFFFFFFFFIRWYKESSVSFFFFLYLVLSRFLFLLRRKDDTEFATYFSFECFVLVTFLKMHEIRGKNLSPFTFLFSRHVDFDSFHFTRRNLSFAFVFDANFSSLALRAPTYTRQRDIRKKNIYFPRLSLPFLLTIHERRSIFFGPIIYLFGTTHEEDLHSSFSP